MHCVSSVDVDMDDLWVRSVVVVGRHFRVCEVLMFVFEAFAYSGSVGGTAGSVMNEPNPHAQTTLHDVL